MVLLFVLHVYSCFTNRFGGQRRPQVLPDEHNLQPSLGVFTASQWRGGNLARRFPAQSRMCPVMRRILKNQEHHHFS